MLEMGPPTLANEFASNIFDCNCRMKLANLLNIMLFRSVHSSLREVINHRGFVEVAGTVEQVMNGKAVSALIFVLMV